jgi:hypothetical protein
MVQRKKFWLLALFCANIVNHSLSGGACHA